MKESKYVDIHNTRGEEMRQKWQRIVDADVDPFALEHVKSWIGGNIVLQTQHWYAFENDHIYTDVETQLVIVTKEFFDDTYDLSDEVWLDLKNIKKQLRDQYQITGGGFVMRFGNTSLSGGSVVHQHAQIIVPKAGKKVAAWFGSEEKK